MRVFSFFEILKINLDNEPKELGAGSSAGFRSDFHYVFTRVSLKKQFLYRLSIEIGYQLDKNKKKQNIKKIRI